MRTANKRVPGLDGLRAFAIGLVLVGHTLGSPTGPKQLAPVQQLIHVLDLSGIGVRLFFTISGFIITHLLLVEESVAGRVLLSRFWLRRGLRILPPLMGFLLVVVLLSATTQVVHVSWYEVLAAISFTGPVFTNASWWLGHTWSLAIEEQFYALWPLGFLVPRRTRVVGLVLSIVAVAPLAIWLLQRSYPALVAWTFPANCPYLAMGCLLAIWRRHRASQSQVFSPSPLVLLGVGGGIVLGAIILLRYAMSLAPLTASLSAIGIAMIVAASIDERDSIWSRFLGLPVLRWLGLISYSLYLWQQLFLGRYGTQWWQCFPQNLVLAVVAGVLSHQWLERPFLALRNRMREPARTR